jgi:hypothetical protein
MLIENISNKLTFNIVSILKQCLRGSVVFCLVLALKSACARPPVVVNCNFLLLEQHKEIPIKDYLVVAKDTQRDYRLRECAANAYAQAYPESFREFIKMLYVKNTRQIAEFALQYFGPSAKEAVPHLMNMFGDLRQGGVQALINIGVDDRASLDVLLNLALNERNYSAIIVLSGQKSLPAYIGPLIISAIEKDDRDDAVALLKILLPIRDDLSIDYFFQFQIDIFSRRPNADLDSSVVYSWRKHKEFKDVGNIALRPLLKNFWGRNDVNSKVLSLVLLMGVDTPEATALAQQLVKEIIPMLRADLLDAGLPKTSVDRFYLSLGRLRVLGPLANPLGKELLLLLDEQTNPQLRSRIIDVIDVLQEIEYMEALPRLHKLAIEDTDPAIRKRAKRFIEHMETMDRSQ